AAGSSFEFWHGISLRLLGRLLWQAGHGRRRGAFAHHLLGHGRWRRGRRGNRLAMRALVALLLALFQALQRLVDAHSQKLDNQVLDAQPALEFLDGFGSRGELEQDVSALAVPIDFVGQLALAPFFHFVHRAAGVRDGRLHLFDEGVHLLVRRVRLRYKQLFVNSHASSFEPGARRLNFVMAFSTPSAIMETTASAPSATSCSNSLRSERLNGDSKYSIPLLSGWPGWIPTRTRTKSVVPRLRIAEATPLWPAGEARGLMRRLGPGRGNSAV